MQALKLPLIVLTISLVTATGVLAGQASGYQEGEITNWSKGARNLVLGGPPLGAEGQSGVGVTAVALRTNRFSLHSGDYTYEFESPRKDFEVGEKVRFRIDGGRLFVVVKKEKELKYEVLATKKKPGN